MSIHWGRWISSRRQLLHILFRDQDSETPTLEQLARAVAVAMEAIRIIQTLGLKLNLFSSAIKINTQYMHTLWFDLDLGFSTTAEEVKSAERWAEVKEPPE